MQRHAQTGPLMFGLSHEIWIEHIARRKARLASYQVIVISILLYRSFQRNINLSIKELIALIKDHFEWDDKTIHKYIEAMKDEGLIDFESSPSDRRKKFVLMTNSMLDRWKAFNDAYMLALKKNMDEHANKEGQILL